MQARELPSIHQQFLDERHIHQPPPQQGSYHQLQPRTESPGYPAAPRAQAAKRAAPGASASATIIEQHPTLTAQLRKKTNRAGSLDTGEGDGGGGGNQPPDTPGQVAAISSTDQAQAQQGSASGHASASAAGFKSPAAGSSPGGQVKQDSVNLNCLLQQISHI